MRLPESVQQLADVIGREKALQLVGALPRSYGNRERIFLYVPRKLKIDHPLVRILGWPDARKVVYEFGGIILELATCHNLYRHFRNQSIRRMNRDEGMKPKQIAAELGMSVKQVQNVLAEKAPEDYPEAANDNAPHSTPGRAQHVGKGMA